MPFFQTLRNALALPALAANAPTPALTPFTGEETPLAEIVYPASATARATRISRSTALNVSAVHKARRIICSSIARLPLVVEGPGPSADWLTSTAGPVSPFQRMLWTVDDLLFYGRSLWAVERDDAGHVTASDRVPYADWAVDATGKITYKSKPISAKSVILIPGSDEGILAHSRAIAMATSLDSAARRAARNPIPHTELHQVSGEPLSNEGIKSLIESWCAARDSDSGPISYTNRSIEAKFHGTYDTHLLTEGRSYSAMEIARLTGIPAIMLDASNADGTMRYSNVDARNLELVDFCLASFMAPITARLGMDDVVAPGQSVSFDLTDLTSTPSTSRVPEDRKI